MSKPREQNLRVYRGDDYVVTMTFTDPVTNDPVDLSSFNAIEAQVRLTPDHSMVSATFAVDTTDADDGVLVLSLTNAQTRGLTGATYVYDLQRANRTIIPGELQEEGDPEADPPTDDVYYPDTIEDENVLTLVAGTITLIPDITR